MLVIFVEFIDQLIDYPINRASPSKKVVWVLRCSSSGFPLCKPNNYLFLLPTVRNSIFESK